MSVLGDLVAAVHALASRIGDEIQASNTLLGSKADLIDGVVPANQLPPAQSGEPGFSTLVFTMPGEVTATTGGVAHVLPYPCTVERVTSSLAVAPTDVPIDLDVSINGTTAWADPAGTPSVPVGARVGTLVTPDSTGPYPAGTPVVASVLSADTVPGGAPTTPTLDLPVATYTSGPDLVPSAAIPLPEDLADGKLWYVWATAGTRITGIPAGWTEVRYVTDTALSLHCHLLRKTAGQSESTTQTVTLGASGPLAMSSFCLANSPGAGEGIATAFSDAAVNNFVSPSLVTAGADRVGFWMFAQRLTTGATATVTIAGDAAPTEVSDIVTARPTTVNILNAVATKTLPTAGTAGTAQATSSGPTGRWVALVLAVGPSGTVRSPGEDLSVYVTVREVSA